MVGGIVGGILGNMGGDALGGFLGKSMFGTDPALKQMPAAGPLMMANAGQNIPPVMGDIARSFAPPKSSVAPGLLPERETDGPVLGDVTRSLSKPTAPNVPALLAPVPVAPRAEPPKIEQRVEIQAPLHITVQGDVKDPAQLARELQPYIDQQLRQSTQQLQNRTLYDEPHV